MSKKILIACNGDWYTNLIHESALKLGHDVSQINVHKKKDFNYVGNSFFLFFIRKISILLKYSFHLIPNKNYYQSKRVRFEFFLFDLLVSNHIKNMQPDICFLWTTMSKRSLKICNRFGIKCILFNGSSPLKLLRKEMYEVKNQNTIFDSWIKYQQEEFDRASFIMVESQFVKQGIISLGIKPSKVKIIPPHVKTHSIQNVSINRPFNICTIQINERKGFIDLISFLKTIDDWSNIRLNLFGSISKEHESLVKEYSEINCLGFLKKEEYYKSLSKMNLAIFPTYSDAGPRALFECMSLGICPIVSERSAGPDHIDDFVNGFVIPINDKQKWVDVLKYCIANPEKVKEMGLNAKHYVENKLDENFFPSKLKELL